MIGLVTAAFGMLSAWKPDMFTAGLAPLMEQGLSIAIGIAGLAWAAYGRFKAQGPLGFFMGGGMSDVRQLQAQVEQLQALYAQAQVELAKKRARKA